MSNTQTFKKQTPANKQWQANQYRARILFGSERHFWRASLLPASQHWCYGRHVYDTLESIVGEARSYT